MTRFLAAFFALALLPARTSSQALRLNEELAPDVGDVQHFGFSRSGASVIFLAKQGTSNELFAGPRDGSSAPIRLHPALSGSGKSVSWFKPCAGERVVFVADLDTAGAFDLYGAPLDGSAAPVLLSGTHVGNVQSSFDVTPDGDQVVFGITTPTDASRFSIAPVDGSSGPIALDPLGRDWKYFLLDPAGEFVFLVRGAYVEELHRVPLDASQAPALMMDSGLNYALTYSHFGSIRIATDGLHAACTTIEEYFVPDLCDDQFTSVFGLDHSTATATYLSSKQCGAPETVIAGNRVLIDEDFQFVSVQTDGTGRVVLGTNVSEFRLTPDQSKVVFIAGAASAETLFVAPVDGSSAALALDGPGQFEHLRVSANSGLVAYIEVDAQNFRSLLLVATDGTGPLLLNGPALASRGVLDFEISPVSPAIVYREDRELDGVFELWSVDLALSPRRLAQPLLGASTLQKPVISPDGEWVAYIDTWSSGSVDVLRGVPIDSPTPAIGYPATAVPGVVAGDVLDFRVSANGRQVVYRADQDADQFFDLYARQADGLTPGRRLTAPLPQSGMVLPEYLVTPDGARVFFRYQSGYQTSLYTSLLAGGLALELDGPADEYGLVTLAPATERLVYRRDLTTLRTVPVDGSQAPLDLLAAPLGRIWSLELAPNEVDVLFLAGEATRKLYRVPLDGSVAPVELGPSMVSGGNVRSFRFTPDSARVVLVADAEFDERLELYIQPVDASAGAMKLSGALVSGGDVMDFVLTPDSTRAVYRADQAIDDRFELHSVPLVGGSALRLTTLSPTRRVLDDYRLSPTGTVAYYRVFADATGKTELFRVPIDSSAAPLRLHDALGSGAQGVSSFLLSGDGGRIVFRAAFAFDSRGLYSVAESGGAVTPLVTLSGSADISSFRLSSAASAYYLADPDIDSAFALFRVPTDGSSAPTRVHEPLAATSDVESDFVPLRAGVVFRADLVQDQRTELFRSQVSEPTSTKTAARPTVTRQIVY